MATDDSRNQAFEVSWLAPLGRVGPAAVVVPPRFHQMERAMDHELPAGIRSPDQVLPPEEARRYTVHRLKAEGLAGRVDLSSRADEIVQGTYTELMASPRPYLEVAYIKQRLAFRAKDVRRAVFRANEVRLEDDDPSLPPAKEPDPAEQCAVKDLFQYILARLDPREREVVIAHAVDDAEFKDIGARFGVSTQRAHVIYHQAVEKIITNGGWP